MDKLLSRKLVLVVVVLVLLVADAVFAFGLDAVTRAGLVGIVGAYVIGQGIADSG